MEELVMSNNGKLERENATYAERHGLHLEPMSNTLDKREFQERVKKVFNAIADKIGKSLGPGGETTFIANYPYIHPTKDGYTIMKSLSFDLFIDDIIKDMADKICSRLNYTVGDGTTSAIMATNSVYESIEKAINNDSHVFKSRDVMRVLNEIRDDIISSMRESAIDIRDKDPKKLRKTIEDIASISSNGNQEIVELVASLYEKLMYPAITVTLAKDGQTKSKIVDGYSAEVMLTDNIYINNDNNTMSISDADIIMFDHKVNEVTYKELIKPLNMQCSARGRKLVVIAPFYDEKALTGVMRRDLLDEYNKTKNINLVLCVCRNMSGNHKLMLSDLAMLLNTELISTGMEDEIVNGLKTQYGDVNYFINIDNRDIPNTIVTQIMKADEHKLQTIMYEDLDDDLMVDWSVDLSDQPTNIKRVRLGFAKTVELGLESSTFKGFYYNEDLYEKFIKEAKIDLENTIEKYKKLGSFSTEVSSKQKRLYRLGLKMGIIEVGGESDISQKYLKDAVDDTVRATESAFNNGIVQGCHVTLLTALYRESNLRDNEPLRDTLLNALISGFESVYSKVLLNSDIEPENILKDLKTAALMPGFKPLAYDVITGQYNGTVINSCETDIEILRAVIDLVGLIITANQLVICEGRNSDN